MDVYTTSVVEGMHWRPTLGIFVLWQGKTQR